MVKLKFGVVGCGDIAGFMGLISRLVPQVTLAACCDVHLERANTFARRFGIRQVFTDYAAMLAGAELDAVYLAVPHHLHYEMLCAAVQAGKPALAEKPLTRTLSEGRQLVALLQRQPAKVGVNYQYRYDRGAYALAHAVQCGALGRIYAARINVPWRRTQAYFDKASWHKTLAQAGGGTLLTQGSHFLDLVLWALAEPPRSAQGYTVRWGFDVEIETLAHGIVETESGALVQIASSMVAAREQAVTVEIYGERGTGRYTNLPWPRVNFSGVKVRQEPPPVWGVHALQSSLVGFCRWVLADKPYLTPASEALPVLAAVEAIYQSAKTGQRIRIL